jgi:hypothetical protein
MRALNRLLPTCRPLFRAAIGLALVFGPLFGPTPAALVAVPVGTPAEEYEEKTEGAKSVVEWAAPTRAKGGRPASTGAGRPAQPRTNPASPGSALTRAAFCDPFRNGLGSPFRC